MITAPAYRIKYHVFFEFNGNANYMKYLVKKEFNIKFKRLM